LFSLIYDSQREGLQPSYPQITQITQIQKHFIEFSLRNLRNLRINQRRSPISKCFLQVLPGPRNSASLSLSIAFKVLFEIPGCADAICGKDQVLKLARPGVIEIEKILGRDFKIFSQRVADRVPQ
jgi:hypothetical protein